MEDVEDGEDGEDDEPEPEEDIDLLVEDVDRKDTLGVVSLDVTAGTVLVEGALGHPGNSVLHSHWSRNVEARPSLVESFIVMLRQLSYAIKNQLGHPKPPTRGFGTQRPNGSLLAPRWFFMA